MNEYISFKDSVQLQYLLSFFYLSVLFGTTCYCLLVSRVFHPLYFSFGSPDPFYFLFLFHVFFFGAQCSLLPFCFSHCSLESSSRRWCFFSPLLIVLSHGVPMSHDDMRCCSSSRNCSTICGDTNVILILST